MARRLLAAACGVACAAALRAGSQNIMLPMADGVLVHTVVDTPAGAGPSKRVPAIMERSPYGANAEELIALVFADLLGYAAVRQDMRGTHQSDGNFSLWHDSAGDAYTTIEWITSQVGCVQPIHLLAPTLSA